MEAHRTSKFWKTREVHCAPARAATEESFGTQARAARRPVTRDEAGEELHGSCRPGRLARRAVGRRRSAGHRHRRRSGHEGFRGDGGCAGGCDLLDLGRILCLAGRAERLREIDAAAARRRPDTAQLRTPECARPGSGRAAQGRRHDVPEADPARLADGGGERAPAERARRPCHAGGQKARDRPSRTRRPERVRVLVPAAVVGRYAAARRAGAAAANRRRHPAPRRAVRGARRIHARTAEPRAASDRGGGARDDAVRDAQHRGGDLPRRPRDGDDAASRAARRRRRRPLRAPARDRASADAGVQRAGLRGAGHFGRPLMAVSATSTPAAVAPSRENVWLRRVVSHILIFAALIAAWEAGSRVGWLDPLTTPRPSDIAGSIFTIYLDQKNVYWHFFVTFVEAMAGFVIGSAAGGGLAIFAGLNEPFRRYIQPYILVPQVTPRVALTPILIAWLGFGWSPKIAIAALICFFPPFVNTVTGMLSVDEDAREMFRSLGATKSQIFWKLQLPSSMPVIMAGLKIASSFAVLLSLTALGFVLFKAAEFADSRIVFWNHDDRLAAVGRKRAAAWQAGDRR